MTGFNSVMFDEASIMKVLDQTKSEFYPPIIADDLNEFDELYFESELQKFKDLSHFQKDL